MNHRTTLLGILPTCLLSLLFVFTPALVTESRAQAAGTTPTPITNWTTAAAVLSADIAYIKSVQGTNAQIQTLQSNVAAAQAALATMQTQYTAATNQAATLLSQNQTLTAQVTQANQVLPLISTINTNLPSPVQGP